MTLNLQTCSHAYQLVLCRLLLRLSPYLQSSCDLQEKNQIKVKGSSYTVTRKEVQPKKQGKSICYFHCVTQLTSESCCKLFIANFKHCTFVYFSLLMSFFFTSSKILNEHRKKKYQTKSSKPLIFMLLHQLSKYVVVVSFGKSTASSGMHGKVRE